MSDLSEYDLVAMLDDQGRFVYASPSHEAILGYSPDELHGMIGMNLVHPDDVAPATEQVAQQRGEAGKRVVRVRTRSGAWVRLEGSIYPIGGDSALARHSIMTLRNIDARDAARRAQEAEREHGRTLSAHLEAVLQHAPVGIGLVDRGHRFVLVNDELAAINGVPVGEHAGRTLGELLPELAPTLLPLYDRVLATGEPIRGIQIEGETSARAGERRSWDASYHAVPGPDGAPEAVIAVIQETTRVRREELERERLRRLVEASSDFVILTAPMANVVYLNAAGRRLAGLAPDGDVTKLAMLELVGPEHRRRLEAEVLPALETDRVWLGTFPIRDVATGETVDLDWSAFSVDDAEYGVLLGGVGRDQRERHAAEARARESSEAYETLFTLSPVPIFSMDLERTIVRVNPAMEAVFGWSAEDLIGKTPPTAEPSAEVLQARRSLREGHVVSQKSAVRRQDGSMARVIGYGSPQFDAAGAHVGSIGFLFDIEEQEAARERAEQVGRQQEAVAELSLFALGDVPVPAVLDRATTLLADRLDAAFAGVLELQPGGRELRLVAGVGWEDGLVGAATVEYADDDARFSGSPVFASHDIASGISSVIREEGGGVWGVLSAHTAEHREFSQDDATYLQAMANVIAAKVRRERTNTQLRELTRELERRVEERTHEAESAREEALSASIAKTDFLSRMSHELRTPLNAIVGFGQLLAMDQRDPGQSESVDQILAAGLHLVSLIDELLDVSQIEAGTIGVELESIRVAELADEVVGLVSPLLAKKGIAIELSGATDAAALADPRRLRQVLLNLLSNAIKYNRDDGRVEVVFAEGPTGVSISVRDTGHGIAGDEIARIFEPFHRVPGSTRVEGTGLGLAVSRGLVEAMGGTIRVESTRGAGSTFTVELPSAPQ